MQVQRHMARQTVSDHLGRVVDVELDASSLSLSLYLSEPPISLYLSLSEPPLSLSLSHSIPASLHPFIPPSLSFPLTLPPSRALSLSFSLPI